MNMLPPLAAVSTGVFENFTTVLIFILFGIFFVAPKGWWNQLNNTVKRCWTYNTEDF